MPWLTGLDRVARETGYPVIEVDGWTKRGHGAMSVIKSVTVHHTAGPATGNAPTLGIVTRGRVGLPGPLSHYVLGRDGTIYVVAAGLCWHAGKTNRPEHANPNSIGIEAENTGLGEPWSDKQLDAYVKLCRALCDEFKLNSSAVVGHKEACWPTGRKVDPRGIDMDVFRSAVARGSWLKPLDIVPASSVTPAKKPATVPTPGKKVWPEANLTVGGKHTSLSHAAWVTLMAAAGFKDKELSLALQRWLHDAGSYRGTLDGVFGPLSVKALQTFLKGKGHYRGAVDGDRGPLTVKAEIAYLNAQRKYL